MPTTAFPVNPTLTAIAIGYKNTDDMLIADDVLPRVPTGKKFKYTKYSAEQGYTVPDTKVGRKSEPTMVDFGGTEVSDECMDFGLDDLVPNDEVAAFEAMDKPQSGGPIDPRSLSTMMLTNLVTLDREIRVANLVTALATYLAAQRTTLSGASQWSDANSNPLSAILSALDIPLIRPNKVVMGRAVWTQLRQHPKVVQAVYKSQQGAGTISLSQLAELLEVQKVLVGSSFVNTAKKGQAASYARVWGKHCALVYSSELAAQTMQPNFGFTAQFGTKIAGDMSDPKKGLRGGVVVRAGESVKEVISSQDAGYFFQNAVA